MTVIKGKALKDIQKVYAMQQQHSIKNSKIILFIDL